MKRILVAIDGSPTSEQALREAREVAEKEQAEVKIMTVITHASAYAYAYTPALNNSFEEEAVKNAKKVLAEAEKVFEGYPGKVESVQVHGDAASMIIQQVENDLPDLLVIGSRGMGGFQRLILGSTVSKVLNHVCCNILVVRQCEI
ncbi:universal stress protein [Anoxynatronum buryatiense]|uniref:Universal stress protein n=1 Tax=Anoxynatronum buryatiense TaxID=489973 RepID=A0AA45WZ21_9CLOT|nr:universal stress protein [Anoxynatronum buryatiense]SMP66185.1 Nucleotide-binding universal stress protein, UspA family [Anoxynatronum buryatiense]